MTPQELRYTPEHEWVAHPSPDGDASTVRVGITAFAAQALGDVVYVSPAAVGQQVTRGEPVGEVESTKSVSDVYAPVDGVVVARNSALDGNPELVNADPYGEGWLVVLQVRDAAALERRLAELLSAEAYDELTAGL